MPALRIDPPHSHGEVSASERFSSSARKRVADGGVMTPSSPYEGDTSPSESEWGRGRRRRFPFYFPFKKRQVEMTTLASRVFRRVPRAKCFWEYISPGL